MTDEQLLELHEKVKKLETKDASYIAGFIDVMKIVVSLKEITPLQMVLLEYLSKDVENAFRVKSEHGKFKHVVK